jgi:hypothetical protein
MYFKTNSSILLTLLVQKIDDKYTAVGLALTHDGEQGTKKRGGSLAQERLLIAVANGDQEGKLGCRIFYSNY